MNPGFLMVLDRFKGVNKRESGEGGGDDYQEISPRFTNKKRPPNGDLLVGMTGFEPATTRPPDVYSTGLSYIP